MTTIFMNFEYKYSDQFAHKNRIKKIR